MLELVMVIVIIGVIAGIAVPRFSDASQNARFNATRASWNVFEKAMFLYEANYNAFPPTMQKGEFESALKEFMKEDDWLAPAPMGGNWVFANTATLGIGIQQDPVPAAIWLRYDRLFDDGDLNSGVIQRRTNVLIRHFVDPTAKVGAPDLVGGELGEAEVGLP